ncbi:hypothetical protein PMIN05_012278 [Paraphaeosphaeria minitans]
MPVHRGHEQRKHSLVSHRRACIHPVIEQHLHDLCISLPCRDQQCRSIVPFSTEHVLYIGAMSQQRLRDLRLLPINRRLERIPNRSRIRVRVGSVLKDEQCDVASSGFNSSHERAALAVFPPPGIHPELPPSLPPTTSLHPSLLFDQQLRSSNVAMHRRRDERIAPFCARKSPVVHRQCDAVEACACADQRLQFRGGGNRQSC